MSDIDGIETEKDDPLISVIIPAYNAAKYIKRAINSVINQTYNQWEILVIDDGSTDDLSRSLEDYSSDLRIHYLHQKNAGPSGARNHGIRKAKGPLVSFLDADDEYPLDKLLLQKRYLETNPEVDFVSGDIQYVGDKELSNDILFDNTENQSMRNVHLGAMLCKKEVFEIVGVFDESLRQSEDIDWWMRCLEKGINYAFLPQIALRYHRHQGNMTLDLKENNRYFFKALHQSIQRRRKQETRELPNLIRGRSHTEFSGRPEISILVWWPDHVQEGVISSIQHQFQAVEILLLHPQGQVPALGHDINSQGLQVLAVPDFQTALVKGFQRASCEFLTLFAPDVRRVDRKLALQLDFLKRHKDFASCSCLIGKQNSEGQLSSICPPKNNFPRLFRRGAYTPEEFIKAFEGDEPSLSVIPRVLEYHEMSDC